MRILKTSVPKPGESALRFEEEFVPGECDAEGKIKRPYAILSHAWGDEEVIYTDVIREDDRVKNKKGYPKLMQAIEQARNSECEYLWADTVCIDKRHSAELQEAINSMYSWYGQAYICLAYLADVPINKDVNAEDSKFVSSRWFTRGWTLQELIAPQPFKIEFFSREWKPLGNRVSLSHAIERASAVDIDILEGRHPVETASIATRMSWAAHRQTKRPEDWAYCLMGLFSVNMPMLYGEGRERAFLRLQQEIMRNSDDHSIFAWVDRSMPPGTAHGLLADSPAAFGYPEVSSLVTYSPFGEQSAFAMTNRGLEIQLHLTPVPGQHSEQEEFAAALNCPHPQSQSGFLAIRLRKKNREQDQYVRVDCHKFTAVRDRGQLTSVLVPQFMPKTSAETVYPLHLFLLRSIEPGQATVLDRRHEFDWSDRRLLGAVPERAFKIAKEERQWAAAIHLGSSEGESGIAILLGTQGRFDVGFAVIEADSLESAELRELKKDFESVATGSTVHLRHQDVRVDMPSRATSGIKTYDVYVTIRGHYVGENGQQSPREPIRQAVVDFAKGVLNPSSAPFARPARSDRLFRAVGLRV